MIVKRVPIKSLRTDPDNVRLHGDRNLKAIASSLKRFGQVEPLVVQKGTGRVIGGNARLQVFTNRGDTEFEIVDVDVTDAEAAELGVALNRSGELAEWDEPKLGELLASIRDDVGLDVAGFDEAELDRLIAGANCDDPPRSSLVDQFGVPPFSVFDARQGYWQDRKRAWLALGLQSELGRGEQLLDSSE